MKLDVLDTTLRERTFGSSFATGERLVIADQLDSLGVSFVESRAPGKGSLASDEYLKRAPVVLKRGTKSVLFLETCSEYSLPESVTTVALRANCWRSHLTENFSFKKLDPQENLKQIGQSVLALTEAGKDVFLHAEHFFDGVLDDTPYALGVLETGVSAGAMRAILCDSRGSSLPDSISQGVKLALNHLASSQGRIIGIHAHNDAGLAVANTLVAVEAGARHVEGSINGLGERAGCTDLCQLLPIFILRLGYDCLNTPVPKEQQLLALRSISKKISDISGVLNPQQPFVGERAFSHADPIHVSSVSNWSETYEAINPAQVGNSRRLGIDDASLILGEMWELGLYTKNKDEVAGKVLKKMRELEANGHKFDDSRGSVHLLILEALGFDIWPFHVRRWETSTMRSINNVHEVSGSIEVEIFQEDQSKEKKIVNASAKGVGPIHAIDMALRKCLEGAFPELGGLKLVSYSLNIVDSLHGTSAAARARTEFADTESVQNTTTSSFSTWATTAVSDDVLDASIRALIDGYRYKLIFRSKTGKFTLPDWKTALSWRYSERC